MAKIIILGATGSLGTHVAEQAVAGNHQVSVLVRTPAKLSADLRDRVTVHQADIAALPASQLAAVVRHHDALINAAGLVSDGPRFIALVDHIVTSVETLPEAERPVCWFLAGAGLLDIGDSGRRGVDLPVINKTYWPHAANFTRLRSSSLDWRLLCPGQWSRGHRSASPGCGYQPIGYPWPSRPRRSSCRSSCSCQSFARRVPEMIVPYRDAAALMLSNLQPASAMSHHRIGLALPVGLRGKKERWSARAPAVSTS